MECRFSWKNPSSCIEKPNRSEHKTRLHEWTAGFSLLQERKYPDQVRIDRSVQGDDDVTMNGRTMRYLQKPPALQYLWIRRRDVISVFLLWAFRKPRLIPFVLLPNPLLCTKETSSPFGIAATTLPELVIRSRSMFYIQHSTAQRSKMSFISFHHWQSASISFNIGSVQYSWNF